MEDRQWLVAVLGTILLFMGGWGLIRTLLLAALRWVQHTMLEQLVPGGGRKLAPFYDPVIDIEAFRHWAATHDAYQASASKADAEVRCILHWFRLEDEAVSSHLRWESYHWLQQQGFKLKNRKEYIGLWPE